MCIFRNGEADDYHAQNIGFRCVEDFVITTAPPKKKDEDEIKVRKPKTFHMHETAEFREQLHQNIVKNRALKQKRKNIITRKEEL